MSSTGKLQFSPTTQEEKRDIRFEARRWRYTTSAECQVERAGAVFQVENEFIAYQFSRHGTEIIFPTRTNGGHNYHRRPQVKAKWELVDKSMTAHPSVQRYLLQLLHEYHQRPSAPTVPAILDAFADPSGVIDASAIQLRLHERICIHGEGLLAGMHAFHVVASGNFGQTSNRRKRYDTVEITIPRDAGGPIASSSELLRSTEECAFARVLGIVTVQFGEQEECFLYVMFFRRLSSTAGIARNFANTVRAFPDVLLGKPCEHWVAVYPLLTVRGPALAVPVDSTTDTAIVFSLEYFVRTNRGLHQASVVVGEVDSDSEQDSDDVALEHRSSSSSSAHQSTFSDSQSSLASDDEM